MEQEGERMLVIENCNSLSELRQKLIDGEEVRTARYEPCEDTISRVETVKFLANHSNEFKDGKIRMAFQSASSLVNNPHNLPPVNPQENERNCVTCEWSKDGHSAGTEECHLCMWESQYKSKKGHWIPVSKRLPKKGIQVLCCNKSGSVFTSEITYINSNGSVAFGQHYGVIAWMPLPKPYKAESEE
jgi:hypothetical protein